MTPVQKRAARHALGLPNKNNVSYRNRYVTGQALEKGPISWREMGWDGRAYHSKGVWYLTRKGAELALEPGESLCKEDFPDAD